MPEWDALLVFVNSTVYGGAARGGVAAASLNDPNWIALHEMGHAAFGLADEYCEAAGTEPAEPNVTAATTLATLKWASYVDVGTPIPTTQNPDCTTCDTQLNPVAAGTVGLFEGAKYVGCGLYRPEYTCLMRTLRVGWCAVCRPAINDVLFVQSGASPCLVATAVYGDRRHPDVVTLRR